MDNRLIILVIVAVVIIAIVAIFAFLLTEKLSIKPPITEGPQKIVPPPATGNVDDLVDALLKEVADIKSLLAGENSDAVLISTDSQEIGDFGQSFNESEL